MAASTGTSSSYIDIAKLTDPDFSPYAHANDLVVSTNSVSDPSTDLTTPLSKALFDLQEIDSNIHTLTSRSAIEILSYTATQNAAAAKILDRVEEERARLNASYARLETEILGQYGRATNAKLSAERSHQLLGLCRQIQKVLALARQFEALLYDSGLASQSSTTTNRTGASREDHTLVLRATYLLLTFRDVMKNKDVADLSKINLVRTIIGRIFEDGEARVLDYARKTVREFAISSLTSGTAATFREAEDAKARFTSAVDILYVLSPAPEVKGERMREEDFEPDYLLRALQGYLQTAITSSSAGMARALAQLPGLDRALVEVSARCQNVVALEQLLRTLHAPKHPSLAPRSTNETSRKRQNVLGDDTSDEEDDEERENLLDLLLTSLDTSSLPSYFWRSLASQLTSRVQEILNRGGLVARTLRAHKDELRTQIRDCVLRGSKMPGHLAGDAGSRHVDAVGNFEREAAVMVGSVVGPLNR